MGESFEDLGLRPELARAAEAAGFTGPTALQRATIPLLRRGGNALVHAASGSGITAAWGLPLLDRLAAGAGAAEEGEAEGAGDELQGEAPTPGGVRVLAIAPTADAAARAAAALAPFAAAAGVRVLAVAPGWAASRGDADVVIATAQDALEAMQRSALKVDGLTGFVVLGLSSVFAFRGTEALDTLSASVPRNAQRVLTTSQLTAEVLAFAERHARKAMGIPSRPAEEGAPPPSAGEVGYAVVRDEEKLERVARTLEPGTVLFCRSDERAASLADDLMQRGFRVGAAGEPDADVAVAAVAAAPEELDAPRPVSYDVPFDAVQLVARHGGRGGEILVLARELPHLRQIAAEAGVALRTAPQPAAPAEGLEAFRARLLEAAAAEDLEAQLLVLEPLFRDRSPAEIAAAASALLRRRPAPPAPVAPREERPATRPPAAAPRAREPRPGPGAGTPPDAFTRLFVSVGARDNVRPGDLVGTIAGEAGIPGERVGKIEVRDTFSIVEVPAEVADMVIRSVNGTTIKGRSVRVDYDRRKSGPRPSGPVRRTRRE
jgi:ATP-dependent RNA helicase DeaD